MPDRKSEQLQSWLELLCGMIPGISQAILLTDPATSTGAPLQWPTTGSVSDDLLTTAKMAASQNKKVTTALSTAKGNDSSVDTIIALPLKNNHLTLTLGIRVKVKSSQQAVIMQILHWGDDWLQLLLKQTEITPQATPAVDVLPETEKPGSILKTSRFPLVLIGLLIVGIILSVIHGTYRVTAPANLEGKIQRVIVAPFDGYIANAYARAGETVKAGEVIAELDTQDLVLEQQRFTAEKNEYMREYWKVLATREKAQAHIFKSQASQAEAQLKLLDKKILRSKLTSTIDGVIISGDLSRSLGANVTTGDELFEVAPLDEYRLIILVDEKQVVDVQQDMPGVLTLKSLAGQELPFSVSKVSPVFEENLDGIAYRVEARLEQSHPALRPGMQGIAKIDIDQRSLMWIYLHELFDVIRLWAWRWLM